MKLPGNITISDEAFDIDPLLSPAGASYVSIKMTCNVSGIDISDSVTSEPGSPEFHDEVDAAIDSITNEVKATAKNLKMPGAPENTLGYECDVTILEPWVNAELSAEDLKNGKIYLEITAFYEVPVEELKKLLPDVATKLVKE